MRSDDTLFPRVTAILMTILAICLTTGAQTPSPTPSPAATPPSSDIFLIDVKTKGAELKFGPPKKITEVAGYNNQPFFTPDGQSILYTSIRNKQADIDRKSVV